MGDTKVIFDTSKPTCKTESYQRLIGKLLYLTHSGPDISFSVHLLSQFVQGPTIHHHQVA